MNQDRAMFTLFNQGDMNKIIRGLEAKNQKEYCRNVETFHILKTIELIAPKVVAAFTDEVEVFHNLVMEADKHYTEANNQITEIIVGGWWYEILNRCNNYLLPSGEIKITPSVHWQKSYMIYSVDVKPSMEIRYTTLEK